MGGIILQLLEQQQAIVNGVDVCVMRAQSPSAVCQCNQCIATSLDCRSGGGGRRGNCLALSLESVGLHSRTIQLVRQPGLLWLLVSAL